jgi:hypothetical protein
MNVGWVDVQYVPKGYDPECLIVEYVGSPRLYEQYVVDSLGLDYLVSLQEDGLLVFHLR